MSSNTIPKDLRGLRACLVCSLVKSFEQFLYEGCENCDEFLCMKNNPDSVYVHTSCNFSGIIALMSPDDSWVAQWQRIGRFARGIYAISVSGNLPQSTLNKMKRLRIRYTPRHSNQQ